MREKYMLALANLVNGSELGYEDRSSIPQYKKDIEDYVDSLEEKNKKYEEVIDKLKDISKNRHTNGKVLWFDKDYAKTYGELCSMSGSSDTRLAVVCLYELENILKEVE